MEITYFGHSAFRLRGKDVTIVTDPCPPDVGCSMGKTHADIVTVSHPSPNHSFTEGVAGNPRVVRGPGEYEIAGVLIAGVATGLEPGKRPLNTAYIMRLDDLVVCHLGDLHHPLTDAQVEELGNVDVLLVPVGGGGALGPVEAAEVVAQLEPSLVLPMHYRVNGKSIGPKLESVDLFCREMGTKEFTAEPKLSVTKSSLPTQVRVAVLEQRGV